MTTGKKNSRNIVAFTRYSRKGASSRLRTYQYIPKLEQKGYNIDIYPLFDDDYLQSIYEYTSKPKFLTAKLYYQRALSLLRIKKVSLIWIEKELFPFLPYWLEKIFLKKGIPIVVDYDDAIFHKYDRSGIVAVHKLLGNKIKHVIKHANLTLCGNRYLEDYAKCSGAKETELLPTVVDVDRYKIKNYGDIEDRTIEIGWIGSPTTLPYLRDLLPVFRQLNSKYDIRLRVIGATLQDRSDLKIVNVKWEESTEVSSLLKLDIGVMPLAETDWARGKCAYKLIQYMSCGIPAVGTNFGANTDVIIHGESGFLANNAQEWHSYLELLIKDKKLRQNVGIAGRKRVENHYSLQHSARILSTRFDQLIIDR